MLHLWGKNSQRTLPDAVRLGCQGTAVATRIVRRSRHGAGTVSRISRYGTGMATFFDYKSLVLVCGMAKWYGHNFDYDFSFASVFTSNIAQVHSPNHFIFTQTSTKSLNFTTLFSFLQENPCNRPQHSTSCSKSIRSQRQCDRPLAQPHHATKPP